MRKKKWMHPVSAQRRTGAGFSLVKTPAFQAELAIAQHVCNNGSLCGDHCTYFNDGLGRMVMIVSDGMGSGGRAAVDGARPQEF